jgi:hypothetical protein
VAEDEISSPSPNPFRRNFLLHSPGKNSTTSDLQTRQSPQESPFTDEIDISILYSSERLVSKTCGL